MSWFSEITSKAEAMLVKLDQNAAEALQNPEKLIKGNKIVDQAINSISNYNYVESTVSPDRTSTYTRQDDREESYANVTVQNETALDNTNSYDINETKKDLNSDIDQSNKLDKSVQDHLVPSLSHNSINGQAYPTSVSQKIDNNYRQVDDSSIHTSKDQSDSSQSVELSNKPLSRKFTIQTSKTRSRNFTPEKGVDRRVDSSFNHSEKRINDIPTSGLKSSLSISRPGADDIRASIKRSLQEYTLHSPQTSTRNKPPSDTKFEQISYSSHFDNQPNLVQHTPLLNQDYDLKSFPINSSPSFSIDVPVDQSDIGGSHNDIASRLLQQSALKKKSTFYLHKVINRLAHPSSQKSAIINDQMKIRLRRIQLRTASYGRRLNYYFRTYPNLKYAVFIYLILMQILVIYVLIFYQSNSSSNDLSTQIKQQQQEMVGSRNEAK